MNKILKRLHSQLYTQLFTDRQKGGLAKSDLPKVWSPPPGGGRSMKKEKKKKTRLGHCYHQAATETQNRR